MKELISDYNRRKGEIKNRIKDFRRVGKGRDKELFPELCFCLLTPQSKALNCDKAIQGLKKDKLLYDGCVRAIRNKLKGIVRFHNNKARYIVDARTLFRSKEAKRQRSIDLKDKIDFQNPFKAREWLAKNVKGLGYKEASHFLRNIGLGRDIAILDRHILKNLKKYDVIKEIPRTLTCKTYLEIENKMKEFSKSINIPLDELDLLFWSQETGVVFK